VEVFGGFEDVGIEFCAGAMTAYLADCFVDAIEILSLWIFDLEGSTEG